MCSQRHHWDVADAVRALVVEARSLSYLVASPHGHASGLFVVFSYLFAMAQLVNTALNGGKDAELEEAKQRFIAASDAAI